MLCPRTENLWSGFGIYMTMLKVGLMNHLSSSELGGWDFWRSGGGASVNREGFRQNICGILSVKIK